MASWFVIAEYAGVNDYEIVAQGSEEEAISFFQAQLRSESRIADSDIRNVTDI